LAADRKTHEWVVAATIKPAIERMHGANSVVQSALVHCRPRVIKPRFIH